MPEHNEVERLVRSKLPEVGALLSAAFDAVGGSPASGSELDQAGLSDGVGIAEEYMDEGEPGIALDHLVYMIREPGLRVSESTRAAIAEAGRLMGLPADRWQLVRPDP